MKKKNLSLFGFGTLVGVVLVGLFLGGTTDGPDEGKVVVDNGDGIYSVADATVGN